MKHQPWDLKELLDHHAQAGHRRLGFVADLTRSIARSTEILGYHLRLSRDAVKGLLNEEDPTHEDNYLLILGISGEQEKFQQAMIVSEANVIGCISAARNMHDIFSQLVNQLLLNPKLAIEQCDIHVVTQKLPDSKLKTELQALRDSYWFRYVTGFINTTKHRQLVPHIAAISTGPDGFPGLRVGGFTFGTDSSSGKNLNYQSYTITEVLEGVLTVANTIVTAGRLLNRQVVHGEM